jgi:uncharacterized protein (TIGR02266 family)
MADDATGGKKAPTVLRIKLRYDDLDSFVEKFAPNIGRAGLFIRTRTPKPVGAEVRFELRLSDDKPVVIGLGVVRWIRDYDPRRPRAVHGMGVEFTRVTKESREVLMKVLEFRKRHGLIDGERGLPVPRDEDDAVARPARDDHSAPIEAIGDEPSGTVTAPTRSPVADDGATTVRPAPTAPAGPAGAKARPAAVERADDVTTLRPAPTARPRPAKPVARAAPPDPAAGGAVAVAPVAVAPSAVAPSAVAPIPAPVAPNAVAPIPAAVAPSAVAPIPAPVAPIPAPVAPVPAAVAPTAVEPTAVAPVPAAVAPSAVAPSAVAPSAATPILAAVEAGPAAPIARAVAPIAVAPIAAAPIEPPHNPPPRRAPRAAAPPLVAPTPRTADELAALAVAAPAPVAAPTPLPAEPARRARAGVASLLAAQPAAPTIDDAAVLAFLDDGLDVAGAISRARKLVGGDVDAELAALLDADATPSEVSIDDASARLAAMFGTASVAPRRGRLADGTRDDSFEVAARAVDTGAVRFTRAAPTAGVTGPVLPDTQVTAGAPAIDAAAIEASTIDAPAIDTAAVEASTIDAPAIDAAAIDVPAIDAASVEASTIDAPAIDVPAIDPHAIDPHAIDPHALAPLASDAPPGDAPPGEAHPSDAPMSDAHPIAPHPSDASAIEASAIAAPTIAEADAPALIYSPLPTDPHDDATHDDDGGRGARLHDLARADLAAPVALAAPITDDDEPRDEITAPIDVDAIAAEFTPPPRLAARGTAPPLAALAADDLAALTPGGDTLDAALGDAALDAAPRPGRDTLSPPPRGEFDAEVEVDTLVRSRHAALAGLPGDAARARPERLPPPPTRDPDQPPRTIRPTRPPPPPPPRALEPVVDPAAPDRELDSASEVSSGSIDITDLVDQLEAEAATSVPLAPPPDDGRDLLLSLDAAALEADALLDDLPQPGRRRPPSGPAPDLASFADPPLAPARRPSTGAGRASSVDDALAALEAMSFDDEAGEATAVGAAQAARLPPSPPTAGPDPDDDFEVEIEIDDP